MPAGGLVAGKGKREMIELELRNEFHNKTVKFVIWRIFRDNIGDYLKLSAEEANLVKELLCGTKGCRCSGNLGIDGEQVGFKFVWEQENGDFRLYIKVKLFP